MRTVAIRKFYQWTEKQGVSVDDLKEAADELANGLYDADLGGIYLRKEWVSATSEKEAVYEL